MVTFERENSKIKITIDTGVGHSLLTEWNCSSELFAKLLLAKLQDKQFKDVNSFAEKMYLQGWDDKRKKNNKQTWFPSEIYPHQLT